MRRFSFYLVFIVLGIAQSNPPPVFQASAVSKSIKAINYRHRSGSTEISFLGTALMPKARGTAKVESRQGAISIDANFRDVQPPSQFGAEYLTYVLWAISPQGLPKNLGEVLLDGSKSELKVTTDLQVFGLIVAAEPYFSVSQPSDVVVMENEIRPDTVGKFEIIDAKYELLQIGRYQPLSNPLNLMPDPKVPIELYEARNAVLIARGEEAEKYAGGTFQKAVASLQQAESYLKRKERKPSIMLAREAAQTAEEARIITLKRQEQERLAKLQQETAAEKQRMEAELAAAKTHAEPSGGSATLDKQQARAELLAQLNGVLKTRDTERGLVVTLADVLFDAGKYTLKQTTREKLAKLAGIILAHPGLRISAEGYVDTGVEQFNQTISGRRAQTVMDFLREQGIPEDDLSAAGFNGSRPVATNEAPDGKLQKRWVELTVSGELIGTKVGS